MALMRREPRTMELPSLFRRPMWMWPEWFGEQFQPMMEAEQIPVEEFEEDNQHVIRAELPGIDPDRDVNVTVQEGMLRIRAERRAEEKTEKPHYYRQEIRYGAFVRNLPLPAGCSEKDVSADYTDGILTIRLPMGKEVTTGTKIPVKRG